MLLRLTFADEDPRKISYCLCTQIFKRKLVILLFIIMNHRAWRIAKYLRVFNDRGKIVCSYSNCRRVFK